MFPDSGPIAKTRATIGRKKAGFETRDAVLEACDKNGKQLIFNEGDTRNPDTVARNRSEGVPLYCGQRRPVPGKQRTGLRMEQHVMPPPVINRYSFL